MSYKSKFEASEHRAHYQNIATKILREMSELRSQVENSPTAPRRWVWELMQNAKDVRIPLGVRVKIEYVKNGANSFLRFAHNGKPFSADNIRFLIEQISTKDRGKDEEGKRKTTGKFGTGFLTTHLLSEKVKVVGVAKEPELDYVKFEVELDRSGFEIEQITDGVQNAKIAVQDLDERPPYREYIDGDFNTEFRYPLLDAVSLKVAQAGIEDLYGCIAYTLTFVNEIKSVEVIPSGKRFTNSSYVELNEDIFMIDISVDEESNGKSTSTKWSLVVVRKGLTSIATPIEVDGAGRIIILPIHETVPRLFCDFPLIGTERFHFPVVINNPNFNPTDPRDGVFLTTSQRPNPLSIENKSIIGEAITCYYSLLSYAIENNWGNLHLLAQIKPLFDQPNWVDESWFKTDVLDPIRKKLLRAKIVMNGNNELVSILSSDNKKYTWFPDSSSKEIRRKIWELSSVWFPHCLPQKQDIELWYKLSWNECGMLSVDRLADFVEQTKSIGELSVRIQGKDVFEWLNDFYSVLKLEEKTYDAIVNKRSIFPNQNGLLCKLSHLKKDQGDIGNDFKEILKLLRRDICEFLIDEHITMDFDKDDVRDQAFAVKEIISEVNEKANDREVAKSYRPAFKKLLTWFHENEEKAKLLFSALFRNKHLLYDDDEILENISKAEQLESLLKEFNVADVGALKSLLDQGQKNTNGLLPVTQELLVSMGISSIDEWMEAIKDKNLAELFSHESAPTTDMFVYAQSLIKQAKEKIKEHLKTLINYDLTHLDDGTAPTILAGILKDGQEISIVTRPAYDGQVIIYYGSERDILDYEPSELWIDDGLLPRRISLGHILKKSGIVKFPI